MRSDDKTFSRDMTSPLSTSDGPMLVNIPIVPVMDSIVTEDGSIGMVNCALKSPDGENELEGVTGHEEDETDINQMLTSVTADGQLIRANPSTLQSLLSAGSLSQVVSQQSGIQVVTLPASQELIGLHPDAIQLIPTKYFGLLALPQSVSQGKLEGIQMVQSVDDSDLNIASSNNMAATAIIVPQATSASSEPPPGCPAWASRLLKCEKIGDSYRGYVENEVNLDIVLTLHKQQTNSFWGTRQSPSQAKSSTRLMWKSQYVPFDGIPFINSGSRAVVMECQYGPRRKGAGKRSHCPTEGNGGFRQTCPARIYVKKVRKFPTYAVNLNMDKKSIRMAMDKAFLELRKKGTDVWGEDRYYVQLPTEEAHDYHEGVSPGSSNSKPEPILSPQEELVAAAEAESNKNQTARIHPRVLEKIRSLVASGESKLYAIRKQLRKFVVRELYRGSRHAPERHDLTVFPTVNDLKNHIHQALTDIQNGALVGMIQPDSIMEMQASCSDSDEKELIRKEVKCEDLSSLWSGTAMPETVTVTLTQNPEEDGHHIISRIETHLSDGTTQVSTSLTPETAQLLARLQPGLFRSGNLQLDGTQVPSSVSLMQDEGESTSDISQAVQVIPDLEMTPLVEGAHGMTFDTSQLAHIVDMDGNVVTGMIEDTDASPSVASLIKQESSSHSLPSMHLDHQQSSNMSALVDADSANLASIVTSDPCHLTALASNHHHISILNSVDSVSAISDMVSPGGTHLRLIPDNNSSVDSMALVTTDEGPVSISLSGEAPPHFAEEEEHCVPGMTKGNLSCDEEGAEPALENDKIALHMTSDQELGMARLENKVSRL